MNAGEILKLVGAGYKPADIKELAELERTQPEAVKIAASGVALQEVKDLLTLAAPVEDAPSEGVEPEPAKSEPETDYKKLYEELKKESESLKGTLKQIQEDNSRKDVSGNTPDLDQTLADIVTQFM